MVRLKRDMNFLSWRKPFSVELFESFPESFFVTFRDLLSDYKKASLAKFQKQPESFEGLRLEKGRFINVPFLDFRIMILTPKANIEKNRNESFPFLQKIEISFSTS